MNYEDQQKRLQIFVKNNWLCGVCGKDIRQGHPQLGHRIKQLYVKKYGKEVIHHELNMVPVCGRKCNSKVDEFSEKNKKMFKKIFDF
jgi:hypothetical protein